MHGRLAVAALTLSLAQVACQPEGAVEAPEGATSAPVATLVRRAPPGGTAQPGGSPSARIPSPSYGVHAFLWWRPEDAERDLLLVKDMGFSWVKQDVGWRDVEPQKGKFDWGEVCTRAGEGTAPKPCRGGLDHIVSKVQEYGGLDLLVRVDSQPAWARADRCTLSGPPDDPRDLADFVGAMAKRYRGQIRAYEIWNEPNLAREWCDRSPDPEGYAALLQASYAAIKAADPGALVVSAGLSPTGTQPPRAMPDDAYLTALYEAMGGSSDGYFDVLGVHAPGYAAPPEVSPDEAAREPKYHQERFFTFRRVEDLRAIQEAAGDGDKQVAVLEMGWTSDPVHESYSWHRVSEAQKADYLVRAYKFAASHWAPWIGPMITIYLCNADWTQSDEQYWWCINEPDATPRPAFEALKAMPKAGP